MANTRFQVENGLFVSDSGGGANVEIQIPTRLGTTLEVDGATQLDSGLHVTSGTSQLDGAATVGGNFTVRTNALHVNASGNIGIGTTTGLNDKITVSGSANVSSQLKVHNTFSLSVPASQGTVFTAKWANGSNAISITDNGSGSQSNTYFSGNSYWDGNLHVVAGTFKVNQDFIILGDTVTQGNELYAANLVAAAAGLYIGGANSEGGFDSDYHRWNINGQVLNIAGSIDAATDADIDIGSSAGNKFNVYADQLVAANTFTVKSNAIKVTSASGRVGIGGDPDGTKQLKVTGAATITTNLDVDGTFDVASSTTLSTTTVSGLLTVQNSSPSLLIKDDAAGSGVAADPKIRFANSSADMGDIGYLSATHNDLYIRNLSDTNIRFENNNNEYMRLQNDGDLSISERLLVGGAVTGNPDATLQVVGTANVSGAVAIGGTTNIVGAATLDSTLDVSGITTLNTLNVESDTTARLIIPEANNTYNLGSSTKVWQELFANNVTAVSLSTTDNNITLNGKTLTLSDTASISGTHSGSSSGTNTGDQTITLTGDVTGSGTGSFATTIASNVVGADELNVSGNGSSGQALVSDADGSFSWYTIPTSYLSSSSTSTQSGYFGNIYLKDDTNPSHYLAITVGEDLTAAKTLTLVTGNTNRTLTFTGDASIGGTHSGSSSGTNTGDQTITLTGDVTGSGTGSFSATISGSAVTTAKINNSAVTTDKINNSAVTTDKINNDAVTNAKIGASAVGTTEIADDAVTNAKIGASAVGTTEIADDAVTNAKIGASAVGTTEIANEAVTFVKFANAAIVHSTESFVDNNTTLMTSAAIADKIESYGYSTTTGTVTSVATGTGLTGGTITSSGTLSVDFSSLTDMTGDISGTTEFILQNGTIESRKAASEIKLSNFNNDSGWTSNAGTVTGTGSSDRIALWNGTSVLTSDSDLTWDGNQFSLISTNSTTNTGHTHSQLIDSDPVISGTFSTNYRHAGLFIDVDSSGTPTANATTGRFNSIGSYITNHTTAQNSYFSYGISVLNYHSGALTAGAADKAQHYGAYILGQSDVASGNVNVIYGIDTRAYAGSSGSATTATYDQLFGIFTYAYKYDSVTTGSTGVTAGLYSQIGMDANAGYITTGTPLYSYIGTTSTALRNSYGFYNNMGQRRTGTYTGYNTMGVYVAWGGNVSGSTKYSWYSDGGANVISYFQGQIRATADITAYYSDERLKTNLGNITNALDKVKSLNGFYYKPNALGQSFGYKDEMHVGVSAQQVEKILPEVVQLAPFDCAKEYVDGKPVSESGENYKTVQYDKLVPLLIEAIKEQDEKINRLESMVEQLLNKKEML